MPGISTRRLGSDIEEAMAERVSGESRLRAPTMADVAKIARVSPQTVSRVLRDHPHVSEVTRLQVEAAVESTGYRRTGFARALVTGRSMTLGVLTHETDAYAPSSIMLGIHRAAREHSYFVSAAGTTSVSPAAIAEGIEHLSDQGVDGLIIAVPIWDELLLGRVARGIPTVVIDGATSSADDVIELDQERSGRLATEHLLGLGHATVWHVGGPASWKDASDRTTGWASALREAGVEAPPVLHGDWTAESGYRNGLVLGRMNEVTAVFVSSDEMAFGLIRALHELGRRVPDDVSVVGMDDIALARYATPALTTVRQPFEEMGRIAVQHVLAAIDDPRAPRTRVTLEPELVIRQSTGRV